MILTEKNYSSKLILQFVKTKSWLLLINVDQTNESWLHVLIMLHVLQFQIIGGVLIKVEWRGSDNLDINKWRGGGGCPNKRGRSEKCSRSKVATRYH